MNPRNRDLARIHCAKKDLGLDDETYRALLKRVGGVESSADLNQAGRMKVLNELTRLQGGQKYPGKPNNEKARPTIQKIEALLAEAKLPWSYADGIARQMFKVERVQFCDQKQLRAIVTALVKRAQREEGGEK